MKAQDIKISREELKKAQEENFQERLQFIKFWAAYVKTHADEEWSSKQKELIDSQYE